MRIMGRGEHQAEGPGPGLTTPGHRQAPAAIDWDDGGEAGRICGYL